MDQITLHQVLMMKGLILGMDDKDGDPLPILDWEEASHRIVVSVDLLESAGLEANVYRWSQEKLNAIRAKRPELIPILDNISQELHGWQYVGTEMKTGHTRILFVGSDRRYYALTLGQDKNGSWNAITIIGSSNPRFLINRLRGLREVRQRNR